MVGWCVRFVCVVRLNVIENCKIIDTLVLCVYDICTCINSLGTKFCKTKEERKTQEKRSVACKAMQNQVWNDVKQSKPTLKPVI